MRKFKLGLNELDEIVQALPKQGVIILQGELASGKTTLAKAIARHLGIKAELTSPTFSIMQSYEFDGGVLYHYDIYQNGFGAMVQNGLFENLLEDGLHIVEWGDDELISQLEIYGISPVIVKITQGIENKEYELRV